MSHRSFKSFFEQVDLIWIFVALCISKINNLMLLTVDFMMQSNILKYE